MLDPPRKGCSKEVIDTILAVKPKNIIYISCGPATLARDLGILTGNLMEADGVLGQGDGKGEYQIESIQPYDMFPQTKHVESVVCLTRKESV